MTPRAVLCSSLTVTRVTFVPVLIWMPSFADKVGYLVLAAIVLTDIVDGILARAVNGDSGPRRVIDALVDRVLIITALLAYSAHSHACIVACCILIIKESTAAAANLSALIYTRSILVGDKWHRVASLSVALFGATVIAKATYASWLLLIPVTAANLATVIDLCRCRTALAKQPQSSGISVVRTGAVRASRQRDEEASHETGNARIAVPAMLEA
jgi:phosphatidylglycerophosphate synthase